MRNKAQLYLITPSAIPDPAAFLGDLQAVFRAREATDDITALQLRLKQGDGTTPDEAAMQALGPAIRDACHDAGVMFLVNDSVSTAKALNADGVHLGQTDGDPTRARASLGEGAIIGVTCHASRHLAMVAGEAGADYVAFGAFYDTTTKTPAHRADPEILSWWNELFVLPSVAIGGITPDNAAPLVSAGADMLAVSSGVWQYKNGPAGAIDAFLKVL